MIDERDRLVIAEYKKIIDITCYNMGNIANRWDVGEHTHTLLNALKEMPFSKFFPLDYAIEHTMDELLGYDGEFKNIKLTDDMKNWVIREAHDTFDYEEWESHIKKAIRYTLEHYKES